MSTRSRPRRRRPFTAALAFAAAAAFLPVVPAAAAPAVAPQPTSPCGPLDVAFVIDDTASMGPALTNIKSELGNVATAVQANSGNDYQLGLVTFKDDVTVRTDLAPLNLAAVTPQITALTATNGANEPEASDEAVNTAVNNLAATGRPQTGDFSGTWRSNATKMVILVTDAHPGGFDDTFTAADQANAHLRAVQAANKGIKVSTVYAQTNALPGISTIMQDYATTTGGTYSATPANGAGAGAAILDALKNCRKTDVFIKDAPGDTGVAPHGLNPIWTSPDIKVCTTLPPCVGTNPVIGPTNYVVVTLNNPGPGGSGASTGHVEVSYTAQGGAALWPMDWIPVGSSTMVTVPAGTTQVAIPWTSVPGPGHFCLLARWISATDPMTFPELTGSNTLVNTRNNNNIAWHNVDTVKLKPGTPVTHPFTLGNPAADRPTPTDLLFTQPGKPFAGGPGKVVVDLGKVLAERWRQSGQKGVGVRQVGETQVEITGGQQAVLQGLLIQPKERLETAVTFTASDAAAGTDFVFRVSQSTGDEDLGGVEFQLSTER
ncbi:VWA domain-containing protein [Amycolatopsis balhimycina DSM 5908]|uniref:VWA domain-containing protein n=1 Tax=Amycolatopsis balhimycina DSM 5908 TaxID=1081091 RepID=A0A428X689_AMYBA|nr:vWA domain-containing protein [Amycolatopsis balhimycina]RSM50838.1 VWA domain-containing protein [Amycolatopsis balhimycina DSM 5908]